MSERRTSVRSRIRSIGVYLPEQRLSSRSLIERCRPAVRGIDLERITGIRERRICAANEDALVLAVRAARDCLGRCGVQAGTLDVVISCGISRMRADLDYQLEPPLSLELKHALGADRAEHWDVANACAGMLTGVALLDGMIRAGAIRRGLVVSGEYISNIAMSAAEDLESLHGDQLASLTVGDAGAAVLVERAEDGDASIEACELETLAQFSDLCFGRPRLAGPGTAMHTQSQALQRAACDEMVPVVRRALERCGLSASDVDWVVPHQTSTWSILIGSRLLKRGLAVDELRNVASTVEDYGNTASTSHFLALHLLLQSGRIRRGDRVVLIATASGLVVGCTVMRVDILVDHYEHSHRSSRELAPSPG